MALKWPFMTPKNAIFVTDIIGMALKSYFLPNIRNK